MFRDRPAGRIGAWPAHDRPAGSSGAREHKGESMDVTSGYQRLSRLTIRSTRRTPVRVLGFAVVLAVIVAMLAPLAPLTQSAAAADDDQTEIATDAALAPENDGLA